MTNEDLNVNILEPLQQNRDRLNAEKKRIQSTHKVWKVNHAIVAALVIILTIVLVKIQNNFSAENILLALTNSAIYHFLFQFPLCLGICFYLNRKIDPSKAYDELSQLKADTLEERYQNLKLAKKSFDRRSIVNIISIFLVAASFVVITPFVLKLFVLKQIGLVIIAVLISWVFMVFAVSEIFRQAKILKAGITYQKRYKQLIKELTPSLEGILK